MTEIGEAWTGRLEKTGRTEHDGSGELIRKGSGNEEEGRARYRDKLKFNVIGRS